MELFEGNVALPLFISNLVTIMLIVFFGRDLSRQRMAYRSQIARLESKSLKVQMNPHFIYNTLNGIQSVMLLKGEKVANEYIGVFARILRKTLEMSITENLSLAEEMSYLRGYITMQNLRLNFPLQFLENIPSKEDQEKHVIPPMLIQPIIENAIIHGISALKHPGYILITIQLKEKVMMITLEDNGIGRKKAMLNKQLKEDDNEYKPKSIATKILKERIDLLNCLYKEKSEFYLEDLIKENKVAGTKATLILPKTIKKNNNEKTKDNIG